MKLKPEIITMEEVAQRMPELKEKLENLKLLHAQAESLLKKMEHVKAENEILAQGASEKIDESITMFLEGWHKSKDCYPELRSKILQKIVDFVGIAEKEKK